MAGNQDSAGEGRARLRLAVPADAPAIEAISQDSPGSAGWGGSSYQELAAGGYLAWVLEVDGRICGFLIGRAVADEAEILNLAIDPRDRRKGFGSALAAEALSHFQALGARRIHLEVRESNAPAIRFYGRCGFRPSGRRPGYYRNPDEAALRMEMDLPGSRTP